MEEWIVIFFYYIEIKNDSTKIHPMSMNTNMKKKEIFSRVCITAVY